MKFYYSSIKPYVGSPIDSSSGEIPELRIEKASQFWAGKPHPGWKNMLLESEAMTGWAGEGMVSARCPALRCNWWEQYWPRLFWVHFLRLSTGAVRNSAEDTGDLFCEPQSWRTDISGHLTNPLSNPKRSRADRGGDLTDVETVPWLVSEASGNNWQI